MSLDEREDPDEEQGGIEVEGIPFVVNEDVIDSYGLKYTIAVDEAQYACLVSSELQKASPRRNPMALCSEESLLPVHKRRQRFPLKNLVHPRATRRQPPSPSSFGGCSGFFRVARSSAYLYTAQDERGIPSVPHPTHEYNATDTKAEALMSQGEPGRSRKIYEELLPYGAAHSGGARRRPFSASAPASFSMNPTRRRACSYGKAGSC